MSIREWFIFAFGACCLCGAQGVFHNKWREGIGWYLIATAARLFAEVYR